MRCRFAPEALPLEATPLDNLFILEYMPNADGMQLRVYLFGLMLCRYPSFGADTMLEALSITEEEALEAYRHWQQEGLVQIRSSSPLEVEYIAPGERGATALLPGKYHTLLQGVQSLLAPRMLRTQELRRVYDWVEVYGLCEQAVLELVAHCRELRGERVSVAYMDTVAHAWADDGVHTEKDAHARAENYKLLTSGAAQVLKRWNKLRLPTVDEIKLYKKWTEEWGFTPEAVLAACGRLTSGDPSFKYLDGTLQRLHGGGVSTEEAILASNSAEEAELAFLREVLTRMGAGRGARPLERREIMSFVEAGMPREVLLYAAEQTAGKERPFGYLKKLLQELAVKRAYTMEEAKAALESRASQGYTRARTKPESLDYPQKRYTEEDLKHIFINLDEGM